MKTTIILLILISACNPLKTTTKKVTDTLIVRINKTIPKDSVIFSFKHDTLKTYERIIEKQGRATVIVEKHYENYKVKAECDSIIIRDTLKVPYEKVIIKKETNTRMKLKDWLVIFAAFIILMLLKLKK